MSVERAEGPDAAPPPGFLALAARARVVRRALGYAVVVGSVLIAINHGDALLAGDVSARRLLKMALTVLVPYCVSTLSSVGALRDAAATRR
ncbi:MAG: nitrate/nitrite transporter NrtS [Myxococcota bacterium]